MRQLIQVGVLGAALAFSLVGSYLVYFDDSEGVTTDPDGVAVYVANPDTLQRVTWESDDETIVIARENDGQDYLSITVTTREEVVPEVPELQVADTDGTDATDDTDAPAPPPEPPEPEIVESTERFLGNDKAEQLWKDLAPFRADRALEGSTDQPEFGFDEPFATLTVQRASGPVEVVFGAATYGDRAHYVRSGDKVFLVKKRAINSLTSTAKLMERDLHPFATQNVARVTLDLDGTERVFTHENPDDRAREYWADAATPDTRDNLASDWVPQLLSLRARSYVSEDRDDLSPMLSATLTGDDGDTAELTVLKAASADVWFARTSHNRGLVELTPSQAKELTADLEAMQTATSPE